MAAAAPVSADLLLANLTARITQRDQPAAYQQPNGFEPAQVRGRLAAALAPLQPGSNSLSRAAQARMLYHFLGHAAATAVELAAAAERGRAAGSRAQHALQRAGLLRGAFEGPRRVFRLSRYGEDWLLAVSRGEPAPLPPAG